MFILDKFSIIILTRCNLRCRLCCEYVPQNRSFADMTVPEAQRILTGIFDVADHIKTLHLTGGGEPFLHPDLPEMIEAAMDYAARFDTLMLFTNSTVPISTPLLDMLMRYREKILVQLSQYGHFPEREQENRRILQECGIRCKVEKYYGDNQSFGGWVDFGSWAAQNRQTDVLTERFRHCAVTEVMHGNWRTRDGKVHWCSRSQRGMELGYIPDNPADYVDLFDASSRQEKQEKFRKIASYPHLAACDYCSGDQGTHESAKRYPAAEQLGQ